MLVQFHYTLKSCRKSINFIIPQQQASQIPNRKAKYSGGYLMYN